MYCREGRGVGEPGVAENRECVRVKQPPRSDKAVRAEARFAQNSHAGINTVLRLVRGKLKKLRLAIEVDILGEPAKRTAACSGRGQMVVAVQADLVACRGLPPQPFNKRGVLMEGWCVVPSGNDQQGLA